MITEIATHKHVSSLINPFQIWFADLLSIYLSAYFINQNTSLHRPGSYNKFSQDPQRIQSLAK